ncbi:surface lipoprotein assembly modifier [Sphingomonas humi]|uniref:Surface lipoprotein assembly modifier C-terminal domain-containing protein n=1 Tax=Sphingomonas humi TaxID=335630 RepID=A0ABP7RKM0_9SPHN
MLSILALASFATAGALPAPRCEGGRCTGLTAAHLIRLADQRAAAQDRESARALLMKVLQDREPAARAQARFGLARLAESAGDLPAAERWYRAVLDEQPAAAAVRLALGRVLAQQRKTIAAGRELRRAQAAGLPPEVARTVERIVSLLRNDAPYGGSFEFAFAPDSNINRSTRSDTVTAFGLPFALDEGSRGRSGVGLAFAGQLFGRVPVGDHQLTVALTSQGNVYKHRAANETYTTLSAGPQFRFGNMQLSASALAGRGAQGGQHTSDSYGIDTKARFPVGRTTAVALAAVAIHERNRRNEALDSTSYGASAAVEKALSPRLYARATTNVTRVASVTAPLSSWSLGGGLTLIRQLGPFTATMGGEIRHLRGDEPFFVFGRARRDTFLQGSLGVIARPLAVSGFAPVVRVTHSRNQSKIELYDYTRSRIEFGVTRDF